MAYFNKMMGDAVNYGAPQAPRMSPKEQQLKLQQEQEERENKRVRDARFQVGQDKYSRIANPALSYASGVAKDRRENGALSQNLTAHGVGDKLSDGVQYLQDNPSLGALSKTRNLVGVAEGAVNFGRGVLGIEGETDFFDPVYSRLDQTDLPDAPINPPMSQDISNRLNAQTGNGALTQYALDANQLPERNMNTGALEELGEAPYEHLLPNGTPQTHTMPDGTVMDGATHEDSLGVLSGENSGSKTTTSRKDGILANVSDAAKVDRSGTATGNKRDAAALSVPRQKIELSEMLMRVGGAITGASDKGALASIGAGTNVYGAIKDENRAMEMQQYEADQKAYDAEENRKIQRMSATGGSAAQQKNARTDQQTLAAGLARVKAYDGLAADITKAGDNVSGAWDGTVGKLWDRATGDPNAALRLRMEDVRVDAALVKVAQTKGAISDREMSLFLSPMPTMMDDEKVWLDWLSMQRDLTIAINDRISGKVTVDQFDNNLSPAMEKYAQAYPDQRASTDTLLTKYGIN